VILSQKPDKVLLYNYRKWHEHKKASQNLKSTQDSQFTAEDELQIITMEVTSSSKQFYMDRDNTNGR
jgi:hypothetical protein